MTSPAESRYRGLRLTVTQNPGANQVWVTLAVKQEKGRWDDWTLMFPAIPVTLGEEAPAHVADMLEVAMRVVEAALTKA